MAAKPSQTHRVCYRMDRRVKEISKGSTILRSVSFIFIMTVACNVTAQENVTTFGIQLKPIIPFQFFGTGTQTTTEKDLTVDFTPKFGLNFGMVVRRGFSRNWSLETGINLVQRNFRVDLTYPKIPTKQSMKFRYICYEIPLQGMIFVKLGEQLYMNASGGLSFDIYPTSVGSSTSVRVDSTVYDMNQRTGRLGWIQFALLANYGFEWRTRDKGYYYLGVSYHRPFSDIGHTRVNFESRNTAPIVLDYFLKGNYLTIDFRYFFHEKPERRKPKADK